MDKNIPSDIEKYSDEEIVFLINSHIKQRQAEISTQIFAVLYCRYKEPIQRYVTRMIFDKYIVDDIVHDTMIKVYTNINKFVVKTSFKSWIYRIATNITFNYLRRLKYTEKLILDKAYKTKDGKSYELINLIEEREELNITDTIVLKEIMDKVNEIIHFKLKKKQREVFLLKNKASFTYNEIAEILGCSSRQAKNHMNDSITIIEKMLKKHNITKDFIKLLTP